MAIMCYTFPTKDAYVDPEKEGKTPTKKGSWSLTGLQLKHNSKKRA